VIVLGEIRDDFSAGAAVRAALTGPKVFTTLHTEDSVGALLRLVHMDVRPFFVASTMRGVVAQRLARRTCARCREPYLPTREEVRRSGLPAGDARRHAFARGTGCDDCSFTGYRGRIAFFELLVLDDAVKEQLMTAPTGPNLRSQAIRSAGLVTLREDGLAKAALGLTTLDEVTRHTPRVDRVRPIEVLLALLGHA
jgi:type IV pilus assembly protein PilB